MKTVILMLLSLSALAGLERVDIEHNQVKRNYLFYEPARASQSDVLIVLLHGVGSDANYTFDRYEWQPLADQENLTILLPNGVNEAWSNQADSPWIDEEQDDVDFISTSITSLEELKNKNFRKIYLVGYSGGAMMAYRYLAEGKIKLDGAAIIAGSLNVNLTDHSQSLPLLQVHGRFDILVPALDGGFNLLRTESARKSVQIWSQVNECEVGPFIRKRKFSTKAHFESYCAPTPPTGHPIQYLEFIWHLHKVPIKIRIDMTPYIWQFFQEN